MAITAEAVRDLRKQTGLPLMDCKKALTECDGDAEKAKKIKEVAVRPGGENHAKYIITYHAGDEKAYVNAEAASR